MTKFEDRFSNERPKPSDESETKRERVSRSCILEKHNRRGTCGGDGVAGVFQDAGSFFDCLCDLTEENEVQSGSRRTEWHSQTSREKQPQRRHQNPEPAKLPSRSQEDGASNRKPHRSREEWVSKPMFPVSWAGFGCPIHSRPEKARENAFVAAANGLFGKIINHVDE